MIKQTKTEPQETLELKMNNQVEFFSFSPPINLVEECNWLLALTSFEATTSVFIIGDENDSFSIITPGHWNSKCAHKTIYEINKILKFTYHNDIKLHVDEVRKRGNQTEKETGNINYVIWMLKKMTYLKN